MLSPAHSSSLFEESEQNESTDEPWLFPVSVATWHASFASPPTLKYTQMQSCYGSETEQVTFCVVSFVASSRTCFIDLAVSWAV